MKRLTCTAALVLAGMVLAAGAGSATKRPPTTASLMPAYVQAAKYWQSRPLAGKRHASGRRATFHAVGSSAAAR